MIGVGALKVRMFYGIYHFVSHVLIFANIVLLHCLNTTKVDVFLDDLNSLPSC